MVNRTGPDKSEIYDFPIYRGSTIKLANWKFAFYRDSQEVVGSIPIGSTKQFGARAYSKTIGF